MIGFSVPVRIWIGDNDALHETAIVSLDLDGETPQIDIRLAGGDVIVNAEVEDAYDAVTKVSSQLNNWKRDREHLGEIA